MNLFLPYSVWFRDDASSAARSRTETCISLWSLKSSPVRCMDFPTPGWELGLMGNGVLDQRGDSVGGYVEQWDRSAVLCISLSWCHSEGTQQPWIWWKKRDPLIYRSTQLHLNYKTWSACFIDSTDAFVDKCRFAFTWQKYEPHNKNSFIKTLSVWYFTRIFAQKYEIKHIHSKKSTSFFWNIFMNR